MINIDILKKQIGNPEIQPRLDRIAGMCLRPKDKSYWNLTMAALQTETPTFSAIDNYSPHLLHFCGFHHYPPDSKRYEGLRWFLTRLYLDGELSRSEPGLREYIQHLCEASRLYLFNSLFWAGPTVRRTKSSHAPWRYHNPDFQPKQHVKVEPLRMFYPYISEYELQDAALLVAVDSLVPKWLPDYNRADICQDMLVEILSGNATLENIRDCPQLYIKRFQKALPQKYGPLSLSLPVGRDGDQTLGDRLGI